MKTKNLLTLTLSFLAIFSHVNADFGDKVKNAIDDASDFLKKEVDQLGDDWDAIQNYLENYPWKGVIQEKATSGPETLSNLRLNGHSRVAAVKGGEVIQGEVDCFLNSKETSFYKVYRAVIGIKGEGPQVTVGTALGLAAGESQEKFTLVAPFKAGLYQVRFRASDHCMEKNAIASWIDDYGNEPDASSTIGLIYVK